MLLISANTPWSVLISSNKFSKLHRIQQKNLLRNNHIHREAKDQCIIGHANIVNFVKRSQTGCLSPCIVPSSGCKTRQCVNERWYIINSHPLWKVDRCLPILAPAQKEDTMLANCSPCWTAFEFYSGEVREELWDGLHNFFELGEQ